MPGKVGGASCTAYTVGINVGIWLVISETPNPQYSDITSSFMFNLEAKEAIANASN